MEKRSEVLLILNLLALARYFDCLQRELGREASILYILPDFVQHRTEIREQFAQSHPTLGPNEVQFLRSSCLDHLAFEQMVVVQSSIGAAMGVEVDLPDLIIDDSDFLRVL